MKTKTKSKKVNKNWLHDHINDPYVKAAQKDGYRARTAYKLKEIDESLKLIQPGHTVVDLGCAPGAWSQYVRRRLSPSGAAVGELNGQAADVNYTADVKGTPVDFKGDISLAGEGETTTLTYTNEISVKIPMMGAAIEPKVGESLAELFDNEGKLTEQWISDNS